MIFDFSIGAAIEEALSGDIALGRLQLLKNYLEKYKASGKEIDPLFFVAMEKTQKNLERSEDYWGAFITNLCDNRAELYRTGLGIGIELVKQDAIKLLTTFYQHYGNLGIRAATTKAASVAGLYGFSLMLTYTTIKGLLDQHKLGQISVSSATLANLLNESLVDSTAESNQLLLLQLQLEYDYYDKMVNICSDLLSYFYDLVYSAFNQYKPYSEAKEYFSEISDKLKRYILSRFLVSQSEIAIGFILDSSGSMAQNDPQDLRKSAVEMIIDELSGDENIFLVDFDDTCCLA